MASLPQKPEKQQYKQNIYMGTSNFKLSILLLVILLIGCKPKHYSFQSQFKEIYSNQFKLTYTKQLLKKSYNNSISINLILNDDKSGFTEPILTQEDYVYIDNLTTIEAKKIKIDSTESIGKVAEGSEGKHTLSYLISRIENDDFNKLIKKRSRIAKLKTFQ